MKIFIHRAHKPHPTLNPNLLIPWQRSISLKIQIHLALMCIKLLNRQHSIIMLNNMVFHIVVTVIKKLADFALMLFHLVTMLGDYVVVHVTLACQNLRALLRVLFAND